MVNLIEDYFFGEEEQLLRDTVRGFATDEIPLTRARTMAEQHALDPELIQAIGELGLLGVHIPEEYGGSATLNDGYGDRVKGVIVQEELAYRDPSVALFVEVSGGLAGHSILYGGREEQKVELLPKIVTAEQVGCYAITEPGSGSDAGAMRSTALREGDHHLINGRKNFITNGTYGDLAVWFAITQKPQGERALHSAFVTLREGYDGHDGYGVKSEENVSVAGSGTSELSAEDLWVPDTAILNGPYPTGGTYENHGLGLALKVLDDGRLMIAADALGMMRRAIDVSVEYAQERETFGRPLAKHGAMVQYLGEMFELYESARALVYKTAWEADQNGVMNTRDVSIAKNVATANMQRAVDRGVQIHGGYGVSLEYDIAKLLQDQRVYTIFEGTLEINRLVSVREHLKA